MNPQEQMDKSILESIFKGVSLLDLSDCVMQYWKEGSNYYINAEINGRVIDAIHYDGNIFFIMNNDGSMSPLKPMIDAFMIWSKSASAPAQGVEEVNAVDAEKVFNEWAKKGMTQFDLGAFKFTHRSLFHVIIKSMIAFAGSRWQQGVEEVYKISDNTLISIIHTCQTNALIDNGLIGKELLSKIKQELGSPIQAANQVNGKDLLNVIEMNNKLTRRLLDQMGEQTNPHQPAPTIGARWVRANSDTVFTWRTIARFIHTKIPLCMPDSWVSTNQDKIETLEVLDDTPATFPTREQADAVGFLQWWCKELHLGNIGWCATPDSWILHKKEGRPIVTTEKLYAIYRQVTPKP